MELRNHPLMRHNGVANWPPVWTQSKKERNKTTRGEVGVLRYVHANNRISNKCFIVIEYDKEHYVGCLIFDDVAFCYQIAEFLRRYVGRSIKEIGDLNVSASL
jgi:hypothetical protein